ncbi:hypothetical protein [Microvirga makkahensis]|uniref:hypothetical protein n=1 Tax=Microvirga makkahensis TaxID=1128670 RepID=UPI0031B63962
MTIDLQHGLITCQVAVGTLQAMRASEVAPLVRVPWLGPAAMMKAPDAGALGVICPMSTRARKQRNLCLTCAILRQKFAASALPRPFFRPARTMAPRQTTRSSASPFPNQGVVTCAPEHLG